MSMEAAEAVALRSITKRFGNLVAVDEASLSVREAEVHALVGENGAGKSTLMNILYGVHPPDTGEIDVYGKLVEFASPSDAIQRGIGMVHQHFKLAPSFTVAENIILGSEPQRRDGRLDLAQAQRRTQEIGHHFGLELNPRATVRDLPVGLQQRVEILKALYREIRILILDEPTAVLTPHETRELFATMRALAAAGKSIIFITHKLREVLAVSDQISVMRAGRIIDSMENRNITAQQIAKTMVGRSVLLNVSKEPARPSSRDELRASHLVVEGNLGEQSVRDLSLHVRGGEIVGIAGVQGNGQDELVEALTGLRKPVAGTVTVSGIDVTAQSPSDVRTAGLAYIPANRGIVGLSLASEIWENMTLGHQRRPDLHRGPFLKVRKARNRAAELIQEFDIRGAAVSTLAGNLSGGNQQKVVLARELSRDARVILAEQPSQGVDIGAIESIHRLLVRMRDAGKAVLLISADLDEIFSLSDRILVMYRGEIVGDLVADHTDTETVGRLMAGISGAASDTEFGGAKAPTHHVE
jgi:general nucleoside transport system ATP-binding protein